MPNQPKTPTRTIRIDTALWSSAKAKSSEEGTTVTEVIRKALTKYVGVAVLAVMAIVALSACGGQDSPTPVAAERTAVVAPSVGVAATVEPSEAVSECWSDPAGKDYDPKWIADVNAVAGGGGDGVSILEAQVAILEALPDPSAACTEDGRAALAHAQESLTWKRLDLTREQCFVDAAGDIATIATCDAERSAAQALLPPRV